MLAVLPYHPIAQYLLLILLGSILSTHIHACTSSESTSLLSFALTLSSPSLNWTSMDCCQWEGITCDAVGRVTHLHLSSKGLKLKGGLFSSSSLGNLTHLTHLNLSRDSLRGSLDQAGFFLSLTRLEVLDLSFNLLSGELPGSLSSSNNIRMVDLSSNQFHGAIPSSFFQQAKNLSRFNVTNNHFTGYIPSPICVKSSSLIRLLDFSYNNFGGNLPRRLGNCSKLEVFRAGYNNLSGSLPEDIYDATSLKEIAIPANSLHGGISNRIVNLTNLTILDLSLNRFSGMLPIYIGKLSKLKVLLLHSNNLEGSLPPSLLNCTNLMELNLGFNLLEGEISAFNFSRLGQLRKLDFISNHFTGILPRSLYSCKSLRAIRLSLNNLEGQIQPEIVSLEHLSFLSLSGNRLTNLTGAMNILKGCRNLTVLILSTTFIGEEMPDGDHMTDFDGFQNLRILALRGCDLTGLIPIWLSKLKKLEILDMSLNRITGSIPTWLGTSPMLFSINLGSNLISGEIPKVLCTLPMLVSEQAAAQVDHGYLELPFYASQAMPDASILQFNSLSYYPPSIFLGNNSISGNIPTEIGKLQLLHILDLSANQVSGNIPDQISNLNNLETLDLSMNHLSGEIPASLAHLSFLSSLNVSYNNLEGEIPKSTQLQGLNVSAFEGNPKLCGSPLLNPCQPFNGTDSDDDKNDGNQILGLSISVVLGFIIGLVGVCGSLLLIKTWRDAYFSFLYTVQERLKL
ncbi:PREDICTED: tyrosine-sulfated glycopeptide receptor 1-like [Fragaria vesca subsp. vesca]|uniref:tyrosine-sulfated glycopeptide receptor 1-like n=1 Tax=Fragaria vesca subsp. vesca TaxID=101020 RepID=UPI0002C32F3F|nr:PREDICTED: tyrosine-sulfated glycopeptide receptor 1-like [Fragaria vesca subsp. vesca]